MNETPSRSVASVLCLLALSSASCRDRASQPSNNRVVPGPNAIATGAPPAPRTALAVGQVEGRPKPPEDKPNDDEDRHRVHPEWYPTGAPSNPYPPGTVIPVTPPPQGMSIQPIDPPAGQGGAPGNGGVAMQPMGTPTLQPMGTPAMQPMGTPAMQPMGAPGMQPMGTPTMQPMGAPGMQPMGAPGAQPVNPGGVTMVPMGQPTPTQPTPAQPGVAQPANTAPASPTAQSLQGTLGASSQRDREGRLFDVRTMRFRRGQRVSITLQSTEFDTLLRVEPPAGEAVENDDVTPRDTNSRVDFTAPIDGVYRVVITTYAPNTQGAYTVQVGAGEPGAGTVVAGGTQQGPDAQTGPGGTLTANTPVQEYLSPGDPSSGGRYVRAYRLEGRAGDMVTLRLQSSSFDPTLALIAPGGQRWFNDDTTPSDTNPTLNVTLPAAGSYRVEVSSYRAGATGAFSLSYTSSSRPVVAPGGSVVGTVAGRAGQGNLYGVLVGITDYGEHGNLFGCADDARQLAQSFLNARLGAAQNFIVLTDAEATRPAVQQAFAQMAQRVGPHDVFIFFHSGHGNRHETPDHTADPDGYVESIVLRDGEIDSHEMSRMFDALHPDVGMLALDSCYSGGFQRAFGSSPNRFGMYSSEEDVLSQVAERYRAGGYLSYFLRRGVTEGDNNRDGTLRAGELADYLYRQFAENQTSLQTSDGQDVSTWQHLVVNRSGVALNDSLWRFPTMGGGG